jgi:hypothetical protein
VVVLLCVLLAACGGDGDAAIRVTGLTAYAPLTGGHAAVAYLTLHNDTTSAIAITRVTSDEFADVSMHRTLLADGISKMQPLPGLVVGPGQQAIFKPGGDHIMLMSPVRPLAAGSSVTLRFHDATGPVLELETLLQRRDGTADRDR